MIYILSDDNYFSFGACALLNATGYKTKMIGLSDVDYFCSKNFLHPSDIIIHTFSSYDLLDKVLNKAKLYNVKVISFVGGRFSSVPTMLWVHGILPKKISTEAFIPVISNMSNDNDIHWLNNLTQRERQVMNQLLTGKNGMTISIEMSLSVKTVSGYKNSALKKLGLINLNSRAIVIYGKYQKVLSRQSFS